MTARPALVALLLVAVAAVLAACGSDTDSATTTAENSAEQTERKATPAEARAEIVRVRAALTTALAGLRRGDAKAADDAVSEGYLEHFERVEGPLGDVDKELEEKLEDSLREELRDKIRDGGSVAEVTQLVDEIRADLDTADQKLR